MATTQVPQNNYAGQTATAVGGVASAYATYMAGKANRRIAAANARLARVQAQQAIEAGNFEANRSDIAAQSAQASGIAAQAGGGIVAGAGTGAAVQASNDAASSMDRYLIQLNARREAFGYRARASIDTFEGKLAQAEGSEKAVATLLNTGNKVWLESDRTQGGDGLQIEGH